VPRKVHVNTASREEKDAFKKKTIEILVDKQQQQQESFTMISTDELFFFYDSLVRMGLFGLNIIVRITCSQTFMYIWSSKHGWQIPVQTV
jgi:hypothetical protein